MERPNKKLILIMIFIFILSLSGCDIIRFGTYNASDEGSEEIDLDNQDNSDSSTEGQDESDKVSVTSSDVSEKSGSSDDSQVSQAPANSNIQPAAKTELMIYTVNSESGELEAVTAIVPEKDVITPDLIVDTVVESMADQSLMIGIESVTTENDAIIVSFYSDKPPLKEIGGGIESAVLDAIAQSLIDNTEYTKIIYRVEGKAYMSDHIELEIDEVYLDEN
jgi:cytoskeletal protein RodZ